MPNTGIDWKKSVEQVERGSETQGSEIINLEAWKFYPVVKDILDWNFLNHDTLEKSIKEWTKEEIVYFIENIGPKIPWKIQQYLVNKFADDQDILSLLINSIGPKLVQFAQMGISWIWNKELNKLLIRRVWKLNLFWTAQRMIVEKWDEEIIEFLVEEMGNNMDEEAQNAIIETLGISDNLLKKLIKFSAKKMHDRVQAKIAELDNDDLSKLMIDEALKHDRLGTGLIIETWNEFAIEYIIEVAIEKLLHYDIDFIFGILKNETIISSILERRTELNDNTMYLSERWFTDLDNKKPLTTLAQ